MYPQQRAPSETVVDRTMEAPAPSRPGINLLRLSCVAAAYCITSWLVIRFFSPHQVASVFFLPSGIALAALLIGGRRYFWAVFVGSLLAELSSGDALWVGAMKAGGAALSASAGAWLIRRDAAFDSRLTGLRHIVMLYLGGLASGTVSSAIGSASLLLSHAIGIDRYPFTFFQWWVGDTLGIFLATPLIMLWWPRQAEPPYRPSPALTTESVLIVALTIFFSSLVFLDFSHQLLPENLHPWIDRAAQGHGLFLLLVWSSLRLGARGTSVVVLLVAAIGVTGTYQGTGPFGGVPEQEPDLGVYVFYVLTYSLVGMALSIYTDASKRNVFSLRESKAFITQELDNYLMALDQHAIVTATDMQGRILSVNDRFCQTSGYSREELLGQNHRILNSGLHSKEFFMEMYRTLAAGQVWHGEIRNRSKSGSHYWLQATIVPFIDERGKPARYVAIRTDITAQKLAEARLQENAAELQSTYRKLVADHKELTELKEKSEKIQRQLMQAEKMSSIGQLAAGVAHEINNPIGFVNSNLGTLDGYVKDLLRMAELGALTPAGMALNAEIDLDYLRTDVRDLLSESRDGLERVRKIVADLKGFSHVGEAEWQQADLLAGLESTLNVVWHELRYKAQILRELKPLPLVRCVPAQINQVFMNLLVNAAQAIVDKGTITLRSGSEGDQVWIEIADTGCGMDEATQRRLFDPFFTTKPVGVGTGLGMSITWDIVKKHDGAIEVSSEPGRGSCFRLQLPVAGPALVETAT